MARVVRAAGPSAAMRTLDIPEAQALIEMDGGPEWYHLHILHHRISAGVWVTSDETGSVALDDLSDMQVVPVARDAPLPMEGRPFLLPAAYNADELRSLRARARQFAVIHGWTDPAGLGAVGTVGGPDAWLLSDTALEKFGEEVPASVLADPGNYHFEGATGMVRMDLEDGDGQVWTTVQRVLRDDKDEWLMAKRSGSGRDRRLLPLELKTGKQSVLVRDALDECDANAKPEDTIFDGPPAVKEVIRSVKASGLEFQGWGASYVTTSGLNPKSGLAIEFINLVYALHYLMCVDLLDVGHLSAAEHIARRILQIQKAVRRSAKSPDFEGLETYSMHMTDVTGAVHAPAFDRHVADQMKTTATTLKQDRLNREERAAEEARRKKNKGKAEE